MRPIWRTRPPAGRAIGGARPAAPHGLPAMMIVFQPMEIVVLPDTTYFLINDTHLSQRRIFTDGRDWPAQIEPAYQGGYSIGRWIDEDGNGRYTALEFETRGFKGPRVYD